jgi:formimidoylglutamate deiminase
MPSPCPACRTCTFARVPARHGGAGGDARSPAIDSFWSVAGNVMYRFALTMTPERRRGGRRAGSTPRCWRPGFTRVGEFHYLHHDLDGSPLCRHPAEMAARICGRQPATTGIGLTLLPVLYAHAGFAGIGAAAAGQRRFISTTSIGFARTARALPRAHRSLNRSLRRFSGVAPHSLRAVTPEELSALVTAMAGDGPDPHPRRRADARGGRTALSWSGATAGRMAARRTPMSTAAGASSTPPT